MQNIEDIETLELNSNLNKESMNEVISALVDFMFRFKDKKYKYILDSKEVYYVFNEVISFMAMNQLKPSPELQEEYEQAPINNMSLPDFETLKEKIDIDDYEYYKLKEQ